MLLVGDKLGFIAHVVRTNQGDKKFCGAFLKATEGTGRVALYSAFLLIAFLCAYFVKEKRLKIFAIKGLLTLFLFEEEAPKEKALQKENGRIRLRGERCYAQGATFKKVDKTIDWCCYYLPNKSKFKQTGGYQPPALKRN